LGAVSGAPVLAAAITSVGGSPVTKRVVADHWDARLSEEASIADRVETREAGVGPDFTGGGESGLYDLGIPVDCGTRPSNSGAERVFIAGCLVPA
jgi:hypothetical protein